MNISVVKRRITAGAMAVAAAGVVLTAAPPAAQAEFNGTCSLSEVCLFYRTGFVGGTFDTPDTISNYSGYVFWNSSNNPVNDNAASAKNRARLQDVNLYENANFRGATREMEDNTELSNLGSLANNVSSHQF